MKRLLIGITLVLLFVCCEDVVEIDTPSEPPRLSVDALIRLTDTTSLFQTIQIKAGLTDSFFGETSPATLESIMIENRDYEPSGPSDNNFIELTPVAPGIYEGSKSTRFFTKGELALSITHEGERYLAFTEFATGAPIDEIRQGTGTLFGGDETEVVLSFTDNEEQDNFYLFDFDFNEYLVSEDEFYQGQHFEFSYFYDENVEAGVTVDISILGIDEGFFNYMNQLISQADSGAQGPFQTPAATVRGNIINVTDIDDIDSFESIGDSDNFALGYFAVSQVFSQSITIE